MTEYLFILFALLISAFIKGALGLGFSTICLAILVNVLDLKTAISIVLLPSLISNLIVMFDAGNFRVSVKTFFWMFVMAIPGMVLGLQLLQQDDNRLSVIILAIVLIAYGSWGWLNRNFTISDDKISKLNPFIGLITGVVNGATGSQIFPIMPYLLSLNISKNTLVQTINLSFTMCSLIMLGTLYALGILDTNSIATYSLGIAPVMGGVWLGNKLRKRLSDEHFKQAVMVLIVLLGLLLLAR